METEDKTQKTAAPEAPAATPEAWKGYWDERIAMFAACIDLTPADVEKALASIVGKPSAKALSFLDEKTCPFGDLRKVFCEEGTVPVAALRNCVAMLYGKGGALVVAGNNAVVAGGTNYMPALPTDEKSILESFKSGGKLKTDPANILAVIRAGLAFETDLFGVPKRLAELMEKHAEKIGESVPELYFDINEYVQSAKYSEVLQAMGARGSIVTATNKKAFLAGVQRHMWPALNKFHAALQKWDSMWLSGSGDGMAALARVNMLDHADEMGIPKGSLISVPDSRFVRDVAESVNDAVNTLFAGLGLYVGRALAFEATKIKDLLASEKLPASIGAANRDEMFKLLGLAVTASDVTFEKLLAKFAWGMMNIANVPVGNEGDKEAQKAENGYLFEMLNIAKGIDFKALGGRGYIPADEPTEPAATTRRNGRVSIGIVEE
jgi:hypothetical protein